jgi:hypothetical protein
MGYQDQQAFGIVEAMHKKSDPAAFDSALDQVVAMGRSGAAGHPSRRRRVNPPQFVPVRVAADPAGAPNHRPGCIEIILSGTRRVRVFGVVDQQALAGVLAVLHSGEGGANDRVREAGAC